MKKIILITITILLITLLVACKNTVDDSSSLLSTTTTIAESSLKTVDSKSSSNPKKTFHLFDENMVANFDGYKPCEYEDDVCIIKAKIPKSWEYKVDEVKSDIPIEEKNSHQFGGLSLYNKDIADNLPSSIAIPSPGVGTLNIAIERVTTPYYQDVFYDHQEELHTVNGLNGILGIYNKDSINHMNDSLYIGNIIFENMPDFRVFFHVKKDATQEEIQEMFNVLNSIEIIEK